MLDEQCTGEWLTKAIAERTTIDTTTTGAVYSNPKRILGTARDARLRATTFALLVHDITYLLTVIGFRAAAG